MFSALDARGALDGAAVLDLYAGTGALAIEALSRGAAAAVLVEWDRSALEAIRSNVEVPRPAHEPVARRRPATSGASSPADRRAEAPFDLVFVDPPYETPDEEITGAAGDPAGARVAGARGDRQRRAAAPPSRRRPARASRTAGSEPSAIRF